MAESRRFPSFFHELVKLRKFYQLLILILFAKSCAFARNCIAKVDGWSKIVGSPFRFFFLFLFLPKGDGLWLVAQNMG